MFLDLGIRTMGIFRWPLILTAFALAAGTFVNLVCRAINLLRVGNFALVTMMVIFFDRGRIWRW